jgi:hypothetical protein
MLKKKPADSTSPSSVCFFVDRKTLGDSCFDVWLCVDEEGGVTSFSDKGDLAAAAAAASEEDAKRVLRAMRQRMRRDTVMRRMIRLLCPRVIAGQDEIYAVRITGTQIVGLWIASHRDIECRWRRSDGLRVGKSPSRIGSLSRSSLEELEKLARGKASVDFVAAHLKTMAAVWKEKAPSSLPTRKYKDAAAGKLDALEWAADQLAAGPCRTGAPPPG